MGDHYYSQNPDSHHYEKEFVYEIANHKLRFITDNGVFSKHRVDFGSNQLIETFMELGNMDGVKQVLELGSGYGPVILSLASLYPNCEYTGVEINQRSLELSKRNQTLNRINEVKWILDDVTQVDLNTEFQRVFTNPPIRTGKKVIQAFVVKAHEVLTKDGELWLVIQKKQGAESMLNFMEEVFGNAERLERNKGYWILRSIKE